MPETCGNAGVAALKTLRLRTHPLHSYDRPDIRRPVALASRHPVGLMAHATIVKAATIAAALDAATGPAKDELIAGSDEVTRPS
jgi:hypothetical protein